MEADVVRCGSAVYLVGQRPACSLYPGVLEASAAVPVVRVIGHLYSTLFSDEHLASL